jgi:hypothetical protein
MMIAGFTIALMSTSIQAQPQVLTLAEARAILEKTATTRLAPDLSALSPGEKKAVAELLEAGKLFQELYEIERHHQALAARQKIEDAKGEEARVLRELYWLNSGPIAATLDNRRLPIVGVDAPVPGRNVYPWGITRDEIEKFLEKEPARRDEILGERTVVRRATKENLARDLSQLERHPALAVLHPALENLLRSLQKKTDAADLYAVPYPVAYADRMMKIYRHLVRAADAVEQSDPEFARYLRNRSRDLLSNDYESGDASWVTGEFRNLNAQIGSYETYDDALYGNKAFHSLSLLKKNVEATDTLRSALGGLSEIEKSLPYESRRRVREEIPVGVYEVVADFGQARGGNTATILPNDALHARRYGRTILMRENILKHPEIFAASKKIWAAAVAEPFEADLSPAGEFNRTLWHEIGHYLGVDVDVRGRDLGLALGEYADALEEMKADLVSLHAGPQLRARGYYDDATLRALQAGGVRRTLQNNKPRSDQPYQTMQLMQFNYFLENGLIRFDPITTSLSIDYSKYPETVRELLRHVLEVQRSGEKDKAKAFFERWGAWRPEVHEALAAKIREAQGARFRIFRYAALDGKNRDGL